MFLRKLRGAVHHAHAGTISTQVRLRFNGVGGNDKTTSGNFGYVGGETMINKNTRFIMEIEAKDELYTQLSCKKRCIRKKL